MATSPESGPGGGGSAPITREEWSGSNVTIAQGSGDWMTWNASSGPDTLLDPTIPAHPTLIDAGVYLVSVVIHTGGFEIGGWFDAGLFLDRTGFNASMVARSSEAAAGDLSPSDVTLAFAWYCPAAAEIGVFVDNNDSGSTPGIFSMPYAHIQRLS